MKKRLCLFFPVLLALGACEPTVANRGMLLEPEQLAQIRPGVTTREDVAVKLGSPTAVSTVDENTWYYVGRQTKQVSFFMPKVLKQQAVEVQFDDKGVVKEIAKLDLPEASDTEPVDRETPSYGHENSVLQEVLGSFKRARPTLGDKRDSGT